MVYYYKTPDSIRWPYITGLGRTLSKRWLCGGTWDKKGMVF